MSSVWFSGPECRPTGGVRGSGCRHLLPFCFGLILFRMRPAWPRTCACARALFVSIRAGSFQNRLFGSAALSVAQLGGSGGVPPPALVALFFWFNSISHATCMAPALAQPKLTQIQPPLNNFPTARHCTLPTDQSP